MSRYSYSDREVADEQKIVSIYWLRKNNYLNGGVYGGKISWSHNGLPSGGILVTVILKEDLSVMILRYFLTNRLSGKRTDVEYIVPIIKTGCHFGRHRYWFRCPGRDGNGVYCGRRVAKLYGVGTYFLCRHCYNLTYLSRNENPKYRTSKYMDIVYINKIEELQISIKRKTYKGQSTKRQMQIEKYERKIINPNADISDLLRVY